MQFMSTLDEKKVRIKCMNSLTSFLKVLSGQGVQSCVLQWGMPVLTLGTWVGAENMASCDTKTRSTGHLLAVCFAVLAGWQGAEAVQGGISLWVGPRVHSSQKWWVVPAACPCPAGSHTHTVLSVCLTAPAFWNDTLSDTESLVLAEFHTPGSCQSPNLPSSS